MVVNATAGKYATEAVAPADPGPGTVVLDVSNALDGGFPPGLTVPYGDSTAERLQRAHPRTRMVKALNTMNATYGASGACAGEHDVFVAGDDAAAKATVTALLRQFGWPEPAMREWRALRRPRSRGRRAVLGDAAGGDRAQPLQLPRQRRGSSGSAPSS